jgi:hypothetical protein
MTAVDLHLNEWRPQADSICQLVSVQRGGDGRVVPKPNGTQRCDIPEHGVNYHAVVARPRVGKWVTAAEAVRWTADHFPPLSEWQLKRLRVLLDLSVPDDVACDRARNLG